MKSFVLTLWGIIFVALSFNAQDKLPLPPEREQTPLFTFRKFERQPKIPDYIQAYNQNLQHKKRVDWNATDSFYYAVELGYYEDFEPALIYFNRLTTDTISHFFSLRIYQLVLTKTKRFETLLKNIEAHSLLHPNKALVNTFRTAVVNARIKNLKGDFSLQKDTLFTQLFHTPFPTKENNLEHFKKEVVPIAEALDLALRQEVKFTDQTDKILALAYEEFGDFLHQYFYISNAFIAYSIAHHYDRRNSRITKKRKSVKEEIDDNNYLYPSFINKFGKVRLDKINKRQYEEIDSIDYIIAKRGRFPELDELIQENQKRKDYIPWLDMEVLTLIILFLLLVIVVFFLKTKKS